MDAVLHRPSKEEQKEAKLAHDTLEGTSKYLEKEKGNHRVVLSVDESVKVSVPESALNFLLKYLHSLSEGQAVSILPVESEMSTQQAADILNVSRPHLVKMLENDEIPHHKVGRHRRINARDLIEYKRNRDEEREGLLDDLASQAQELDMGY
jgi:excisionase family DNA binding protein